MAQIRLTFNEMLFSRGEKTRETELAVSEIVALLFIYFSYPFFTHVPQPSLLHDYLFMTLLLPGEAVPAAGLSGSGEK